MKLNGKDLMTWGELKALIESKEGVTDNTPVVQYDDCTLTYNELYSDGCHGFRVEQVTAIKNIDIKGDRERLEDPDCVLDEKTVEEFNNDPENTIDHGEIEVLHEVIQSDLTIISYSSP